MAGRFSDAVLKRLDASKTWHSLGEGLYLRLPSGAFYYRRKHDGRQTSRRIGPWDPDGIEGLTYVQARAEVSGLNTRPTARPGTPLADLAARYLASEIHQRSRTQRELERYVATAVAGIGPDRPIEDIRPAEIVEMVERERDRIRRERPHNSGRVAANRLLSATKGLFRFGVTTGRLQRSPAAELTRQAAGGPERKKDRVLTDQEISQLFADPSAEARACRWALLTGARISVICGASWKQIEGERWRFKLKQTRGDLDRRDHWVHIPALGQQILGEPGPPDDPLFAAAHGGPVSRNVVGAWARAHNGMHGRNLTGQAWAQLSADEREKTRHRVAWTPHDLRRTCCTRISGMGVGWEVVGMKQIGDRLEGMMATYNRAEMEPERVEAANRWGVLLAEVIR